MRIEAGTRLGPYQIVAPVGAGGMGQVYRACDTRLGRDVAIKVISAEAEPTEEQRQRFHREARAVAQLAHPHIASLFDVGHEAGIDYLVTELLEGETLAARIERGPLPIEQCLHLGARIASALAAAHARGIVHRDLKPANVMLTATGPKLLDFGLAKAFGSGSAITGDSAQSATLTRTGMIVGTVPYMAPEQLEGREADARTDIFALGALLYEMVSGRPAFSAPTPVALVGAVLASDPPSIRSIRADAPPSLERLIRHCLAKDPADRWHSARDVELQLASVALEAPAAAPVGRRALLKALPWALVAIAVAIATAAVWRTSRGATDPAPEIRFTIEPPIGGGIAWNSETNPLALSPDGRQLAFIAFDSMGEFRIWLRSLSDNTALPLDATLNAQSLMWSPDGRSIAFFTRDRLQRIDLPAGAPVTLMAIAARTGQSGSWGRRGYIAYTGVQGEAIYRIAASGGNPEVVLQPDTTAGEARLQFPFYLSDGERFLYTLRRSDGSDVLMQTTAGGQPRLVTPVQSLAQTTGHVLVFVRDGTLLGLAFDEDRGRVDGEPFAIAEGVRYFLSTGATAVATSRAGTLAYHAGADHQRLVWMDRTGVQLGDVVSTGSFLDLALSPDATRVLATRQHIRLGTWDVSMIDLERGTETPLTTSPLTEIYGVWVPGGRTIVYSVSFGRPPNLVRRDLDSMNETPMLSEAHYQSALDVSPDGQTLLYRRRPGTGTFDLWTLSLEGAPEPKPVLQTPFSEVDARFSPDGRYVTVIADDTGRPELYIMPFPGPGQKTRVSTNGAQHVRWPRASNEIIYSTPDGSMRSVRVQTEPVLSIGQPVTLFSIDAPATITALEVTPDGQRFLVALPVVVANRQPITVIANWAAGRNR